MDYGYLGVELAHALAAAGRAARPRRARPARWSRTWSRRQPGGEGRAARRATTRSPSRARRTSPVGGDLIVARGRQAAHARARPRRRDQRAQRRATSVAAHDAPRRQARARSTVELGKRPARGSEPVARARARPRARPGAARAACCRMLGSHAGAGARGRRAAGGDVTFAIDAEAEELLRGVPRRARARRGLLLGGPRARRARRRAPQHGAGGGPDRRHAPGAGRARVVLRVGGGGAARRRASTMGDVTRRLRGRDPVGRGVPRRARRRRGRGPAGAAVARTSGSTGCSGPTASAAARRGRLAEVLGDLIDASSVGGASFELGSACFDMTCVVDRPARRVRRARAAAGRATCPGMREEFERVGGGAVLNNSPYDLAAAALILEEAGAVVTDAYGRLARRPVRCSARVPSSRCRWSRAANRRAARARFSRARRMQACSVAFRVGCRDVEASPAADSRDVSLTIPARAGLPRARAARAVRRLPPHAAVAGGGGRPEARRSPRQPTTSSTSSRDTTTRAGSTSRSTWATTAARWTSRGRAGPVTCRRSRS